MAQLPAYNPVRDIKNHLIKAIHSVSKVYINNSACIKSVPYLGRIPGGFRPCQMIRIRGIVNPIVRDHICINIQTGAAINPMDDCNLHLSIRMNENTIVRNDLQNGRWGNEERHGGCPLSPGQNFEILILAEHRGFKIALNGVHFCEFAHRVPLERAAFVLVKGEVSIQSIIVESDTPSAPPMPTVGSHATISSAPGFPSIKPEYFQPTHQSVIHQSPNHFPSVMPPHPHLPPYPTSTPVQYPMQMTQHISATPSNPNYPIYMNRTDY